MPITRYKRQELVSLLIGAPHDARLAFARTLASSSAPTTAFATPGSASEAVSDSQLRKLFATPPRSCLGGVACAH